MSNSNFFVDAGQVADTATNVVAGGISGGIKGGIKGALAGMKPPTAGLDTPAQAAGRTSRKRSLPENTYIANGYLVLDETLAAIEVGTISWDKAHPNQGQLISMIVDNEKLAEDKWGQAFTLLMMRGTEKSVTVSANDPNKVRVAFKKKSSTGWFSMGYITLDKNGGQMESYVARRLIDLETREEQLAAVLANLSFTFRSAVPKEHVFKVDDSLFAELFEAS